MCRGVITEYASAGVICALNGCVEFGWGRIVVETSVGFMALIQPNKSVMGGTHCLPSLVSSIQVRRLHSSARHNYTDEGVGKHWKNFNLFVWKLNILSKHRDAWIGLFEIVCVIKKVRSIWNKLMLHMKGTNVNDFSNLVCIMSLVEIRP